jgi:hypothetical protein
MKNEKLNFNFGIWWIIVTIVIYISIMDLFFHYVISSNIDPILQGIATLAAIYYTWWEAKLIANFLIKQIEKNKKL